MTTTTTDLPTTLDVSGTTRVPLERLIRVELRKMVDTRAGMWLLITIGVVTTLVIVLFGLLGNDRDHTFNSFMGAAGGPQGVLLPVLGILLVTQEWGQRTAMTTFALEPHRARVLGAKVCAALLLGLAAVVLAVVLGSIAALVFGNAHAFAGVDAFDYVKFGIVQIAGTFQGLAFGLLILNSAGAIVAYFLLPTVISVVVHVWSAISDKAAWIDFGTAQQPLLRSGPVSGQEWAQITVTALVWVVLPFLLGLWRVLRAEVK